MRVHQEGDRYLRSTPSRGNVPAGTSRVDEQSYRHNSVYFQLDEQGEDHQQERVLGKPVEARAQHHSVHQLVLR